MVSQQHEEERKIENFDDLRVKVKAGKINVESELGSMGITTISREKMILFCFVSSDDIPHIHYGLTVHEDLSLILFFLVRNLVRRVGLKDS